MDQNEFSLRLRALAGATERDFPNPEIDLMGILGRLDFARTVRRFQAAMVAAVGCVFSVITMQALSISDPLPLAGLALVDAIGSIAIMKMFPYWTPPTALREGLLALGRFEFNDWEYFVSHLSNPLTSLNNTLLGELCIHVAKDQRRPKVGLISKHEIGSR
jgi:hypothetical protein